MKRIFLSLCTLGVAAALAVAGSPLNGAVPGQPAAQQAAAKGPQWKSRAEYDAFQAILKATSPQAKITAADAFLQKYPASDFKPQADLLKFQAYVQLNQVDQAIATARDTLKTNPPVNVRVACLHYLSYVFPYIFKPKSADAAAELAQANSEASQGLQLLQTIQKPAGASEAAFESQVKEFRADFNRALGFVALQKKDYPSAINYLKEAVQDNPQDGYTFSFLGEAYLYLSPPDYNTALWYLARAVSLAEKNRTPNLAAVRTFYGQEYVSRHGSDAGEQGLIAQAGGSPTPPAGFQVAPPPKHAPTGNPSVDAYHKIEDALAVGGDEAKTAWGSLQGQPLGILAFVDDVRKGTDPGTWLVRADVLPKDRGTAGDYNLELTTNQENAKYLKLGDPIHFQGTITSYTTSPNFILTLSKVQIDDATLRMAAERAKAAAQEAAEKKSKHPVRRR